jgi:hypothetical protein
VANQKTRDPQDLERLLVSRERAGDVEGMAALYGPDAVLDCGGGRLMLGRGDSDVLRRPGGNGSKFDFGDQRPAIISGDLALTSTRLPDGSVTAEIARRQDDGTWLWDIDQFSIA